MGCRTQPFHLWRELPTDDAGRCVLHYLLFRNPRVPAVIPGLSRGTAVALYADVEVEAIRFRRAAPAFRWSNRLATTCLPQGCRERLRTSLSCHVPFDSAAARPRSGQAPWHLGTLAPWHSGCSSTPQHLAPAFRQSNRLASLAFHTAQGGYVTSLSRHVRADLVRSARLLEAGSWKLEAGD